MSDKSTSKKSRSRKRCSRKRRARGSKDRKRDNRSRSMSSRRSDRGPHVDWDSYSWYHHQIFERYWQHYSDLMTSTHTNVLQHAAYVDSFNPQHFMKQAPSNPHKSSRSRRSTRQRSSASPMESFNRESSPQQSESELTNILHKGMLITDSGKEEVDEEFLAFMEQSVRHKIEWKNQKEGNTTEEEMELQKGILTGNIEEHPDVTRSREMTELYGKDSSRIHAMETSVQLSFDRIATRNHPRLWPNIPLNILFN